MRTLYLIPARGGSKRLAGKNLQTIGGVPLVALAVLRARFAANRVGGEARIVVSTDDEQIACCARRYGADVPFMRPAHLATDDATSVDVALHAISWYAKSGELFHELVLLQPTSPLCNGGDVLRAVDLHRREGGPSVVSVRPIGQRHAGASFQLVGRDIMVPAPAEGRAQVELNGAVYVCSPDWLQTHRAFCVAGQTRAIAMPPERSVDVDTAADLAAARREWETGLPWKAGRCLIIAEAGVNHNGSVETAVQLVEAAAKCGADAVKFQVFAADRIVTRRARKAAYQQVATPIEESQYEMLKRLELSADDHRRLRDHCRSSNVLFLASAFGEEDVDLLDELDACAIKLGSGELTNIPLLQHVGATLRPVILSTGCASLDEVAQAVEALRGAGCAELALLQCVSNYPADPADANLRAMQTMEAAFDVPVGFSDHTEGVEIAAAAVALGARIIEKHFTLDRTQPGPDHRSSLEPAAFAQLVRTIRNVEAALGSGVKQPTDAERDTREVARKSLVASDPLPAGTVLRREHLTCKRPGTGIAPRFLPIVLGMELRKDLGRDEPLTWGHVRQDEPR